MKVLQSVVEVAPRLQTGGHAELGLKSAELLTAKQVPPPHRYRRKPPEFGVVGRGPKTSKIVLLTDNAIGSTFVRHHEESQCLTRRS